MSNYIITPAHNATDTPQSEQVPRHEEVKASFDSALLYTVNHTLACSFYDIPGPFISAAFAGGIEKLRNKPSEGPWWKKARDGHDHGHSEEHIHTPDTLGSAFWHRTKHWAEAETIGDIGAIFPTVALQHYAPGFMEILRNGLEPVFGPVFRRSTNRAARRQAAAFGIATEQDAINARANRLYEHEMAHMPLAFVWTGLSAAINLTMQKKVLGSKDDWGTLLASKAGAAILATGTVFAVRSLAPTHVQKFEAGLNDKMIAPTVQTMGNLMGMDKEKIRHALENNETAKEWAERIRQEKKNMLAPSLG